MTSVLVDSNVLRDVATNDPVWGDWSSAALERTADEAVLVINALVYAEVSIGFDRRSPYQLLRDITQRHVITCLRWSERRSR